MAQDATGNPGSRTEALRAALAAVEAAHPGWQCWPGVIPLVYARRPRSSPPMVVRAATPEALAEAIERAEAERAL